MITSAIPAALLTVAALTGPPRGEVLDFTAEWCGPCQQMSPIVSRLKGRGYPIRKVDVDKNRALAEKYRIASIPAFVLVIDGQEVHRVEGAVSEQQLLGMLGQIPTEPPVMTVGDDARTPTRKTQPGKPRFSAPDSHTPARELTQPVAVVAEEDRPNRGRTAGNRDEPEDSPGLIGKLFGRGNRSKEPQPPDVVRANDDGRAGGPENTLPLRNPVEASVRLHVTINGQTHRGSGTAIDSRAGQTIIVTCGHLFDGWNDRSKIEVDMFVGGHTQRYVGRMIRYDVHADAGLIGIPTDEIVPTAEVAAPAARPQVGEAVVSIGCSGGEPPSQDRLQVTALNYYEGPDNIECTGIPVQGRSGGGLFNRQGQLVGLCIAADAERQRGAYAGLLAIHDLLASSGLSDVSEPAVPGSGAPRTKPSPEIAAIDPAGKNRGFPDAAPAANSDRQGRFDFPSGGNVESTEVICIIQQPGAPSRVVIIDHPSQKFLSYLDSEVAARDDAVPTNRQPAAPGQGYSANRARFSTPQEAPPQEPRHPQGEHIRIASLQPTALSGPLCPQRYVRSAHTR